MKANKSIRRCGPYEVVSISQDMRGVRLVVYPAFPEYNLTERERDLQGVAPAWLEEPRWAMHRYKGDGGGPSIFTSMALAIELENFLNQAYTPEQVEEWKNLNAQALKKVRDKERKEIERAFKKLEK